MSCDNSTYCTAIVDLAPPSSSLTLEGGDFATAKETDHHQADKSLKLERPELTGDRSKSRDRHEVRSRIIPDSTTINPEYVWGDEGPIDDRRGPDDRVPLPGKTRRSLTGIFSVCDLMEEESILIRFRAQFVKHSAKVRRCLMKWITREYVKVDRVACPWLIQKFVDKDAEFIFVPTEKVMDEAKRLEAIPYDVKNVELGHHGKECSFEAILKKYKLTDNRALVLLGKIVNGADTDNTLYKQSEGPGLEAIAEGFRHLGYKDDHTMNAAESIVYDALYAYCQEMVRQGKPDGMFAVQ
jgi:hypothetical protein